MTPNNKSATETDEIFEELEEDDVSAPALSDADIDKKYDEGQAQIIIQRNDFLVPNILQMVKNRDVLDLFPAYQRRPRWSAAKQSRLIESLLMNIPIPPIFLYERDLAKYEVMDGQQRLSTIRAFFEDRFELQGLKKWPELNGRTFSLLPPRIKAGLARRGLAAVIILTESGKDPDLAMELRQYVFERLNTGGERLNAQEVRNCIYSSHFNEMLIQVARSASFTSAWGIPPKESKEPQKVSKKLAENKLYATMRDCEIVLRYFAFSDLDRNFEVGVKRTLDAFMQKRMSASKSKCESLRKEYLQVLDIAQQTYGEYLFRLPNAEGELLNRRSIPLADAVLIAIKKYRHQGAKIIAHSGHVVKRTRALLLKDDTYEALVGRGNTKRAIEERITIMTQMVAKSIS